MNRVIFAALLIFLSGFPGGVSALNFPPTTGGTPRSTTGGGVRGCDDINVTAIIPENSFIKSESSKPTFFWYVVQSPVKKAYLTIIDDQGNDLYRKSVSLPSKPGIIKYTLTESLPKDKTYSWTLEIPCDPTSGDGKFIEGKIQHSLPPTEMQNALNQAKAQLDKANIYAKDLFWNETLLIISEQRKLAPKAWTELLQSIKLSNIPQDVVITDLNTSKIQQSNHITQP